MKVRNKLYISAGVSIALIVILSSLVLVTSGRVAQGNEKHELLDNVRTGVSELDLVTYDYLLHHEERMEQQWYLKYSSLGGILEKSVEEEELISIRADYTILGDLFSQVTTNSEEIQKLTQEEASQEKIDNAMGLEERLVAQLLITSQSVITDASRLAEGALAEVVEAQRLAVISTLILMISMAITVTTSSLLVARSISRPLNKLTKGAEIIGRGDLKHKVEIQGKDELGQLATSFNQMTENLLEDRSGRERAEHDLGERVKELICLYGVSQLTAQTDANLVEILKGTVSLIPPGWQYPDVTCAKITLGDKEFKTDNFKTTRWKQSTDINVQGDKEGSIEVYYLDEKPEIAEGPFLEEERNLIDGITKMLGNLIERKRVQKELEKHREHLEELVDERTKEVQEANTELAAVNKELEAFSYSVSHDLRAPLRSIDGFSQVLIEDYPDRLDEQGKDYLNRVRSASQRMAQLIDDMLNLSRVTCSEMKPETVDLSALAQTVVAEFKERQPERQVEFIITEGLVANGDQRLLGAMLENLLENAWKFTSTHPSARIEFGVTQVEGKETFFVCDDGVGFDMTYADKLFGAFQRLHALSEFPGTGIGLATVQRIIHRHGGRVWAEGEVEKGATFYFTLQ